MRDLSNFDRRNTVYISESVDKQHEDIVQGISKT